ncbi:hypothetical protein ACLKA6_001924 [Drosophila palustris]
MCNFTHIDTTRCTTERSITSQQQPLINTQHTARDPHESQHGTQSEDQMDKAAGLSTHTSNRVASESIAASNSAQPQAIGVSSATAPRIATVPSPDHQAGHDADAAFPGNQPPDFCFHC